MSTGAIILLGAFAGLTIFLGLPLAFLRRGTPSLRMFLSMLATGVLIFLLYDVVAKASEPIDEALAAYSNGEGAGILIWDVALLAAGLGLGLVGLVYFNRFMIARARLGAFGGNRGSAAQGSAPATGPTPAPAPQLALAGVASSGSDTLAVAESGAVAALPSTSVPARMVAGGELAPQTIALVIAIGIGLHNFSEGLAIGQSAATGALALATVLIIGFALHNMTEGFGIAGPLTGQPVKWSFILLLGLIGGGPTFLGTVVGMQFHSPQVFIFFLALAAGAILFVVAELLGVAKRFKAQEIVMWGLLAGFMLGYLTDLIVSFAGA
jgi:zinc transporter, ZIP family